MWPSDNIHRRHVPAPPPPQTTPPSHAPSHPPTRRFNGKESPTLGGGAQRRRGAGHAKVKKGAKPEGAYIIHDPAETIVIDYADGYSPSSTGGVSQMGVTSRGRPPPVAISDFGSQAEVTISSGGRYQHMYSVSSSQYHQQYHAAHHQYHHEQGQFPPDVPPVHSVPYHAHHGHAHASSHAPGHAPSGQQRGTNSQNRSSHSSDTSSAYSGSDTMQSIHSSLENEPIDLSGLHESVVDSDEDLADSIDSLTVRDQVRDCLEKDPADRAEDDIEVLLEFTKTLEAFNNMGEAVRRALCEVMVFAVVEKAGTIVMNDGEELDSWSVIINGEVRVDCQSNGGLSSTKYLKWGDSFGIPPTMDKLFHQGVMRTCQDDCQFVCITQTDYCRILNEEKLNQKVFEDEKGNVVLVTGITNDSKGYNVIRGTPQKLLEQLVDENSSLDPVYVEDFLLTHRTFFGSSLEVAEKLLVWFQRPELRDRVTRTLLIWVNNHFTDFEMDPDMMEFLERFEGKLEDAKMNGQLRMLNFACAAKARKRVLTLTRSSRDEPLQFSLMGGYERGYGIFVDRVDRGSKAADIGLKRGDQILEVNRRSFEQNMKLQNALVLLRESTHLEMTVKSNLLVFKEMLQAPESQRARLRKSSDITGIRTAEHHQLSSKLRTQDDSAMTNALKQKQPSNANVPVAYSKRERVKQVLLNLIKPTLQSLKDEHDLSTAAILGLHEDQWEMPSADMPEHSLKIYKADQQSRYLLVHNDTSARQVVMLALQEFGITECSSNFTLCEVTVDGGFVRQKRLPDTQTNLAERIGLASRYYIKNVQSSDQLIPEDASNDLMKEAQVNLLQLNPGETSTQLMVEDFTIFRQIESTEYIDKLFELTSKFGTPNLTQFGELVNKEMMWVITEIVSEPNVNRRAKIIKQFIKVAHHCYKETQNYNSMFAINAGLGHGAVARLKSTWEKVPGKYNRLFAEMQGVMDTSMNFRKYRNLVSNAKPPIIPIYPMVNKDLTFIHLGNETLVDGLINFEKLRMLAKEVRGLFNMCSAPLDLFTMLERQGSSGVSDAMRKMNPPTHLATMKRPSRKPKEPLNAKRIQRMYEEAQMIRRVKAYLSKMHIITDEDKLHHMSLECEPPPQPLIAAVARQLTNQSSSASIASQGKPKRAVSPTPSNASSASSTSYTSEGKKSTTSGTKFDSASSDHPGVQPTPRDIRDTLGDIRDTRDRLLRSAHAKTLPPNTDPSAMAEYESRTMKRRSTMIQRGRHVASYLIKNFGVGMEIGRPRHRQSGGRQETHVPLGTRQVPSAERPHAEAFVRLEYLVPQSGQLAGCGRQAGVPAATAAGVAGQEP